MPDTNERLFLGEKKKVLSTLLTSHIRERRPGRCRDVGRVMKMRGGRGGGVGNRIKEREQRSRCGNSGQTVGNATEKF